MAALGFGLLLVPAASESDAPVGEPVAVALSTQTPAGIAAPAPAPSPTPTPSPRAHETPEGVPGTPTPTPVPTPTPYTFSPPLSLNDALVLMDRAQDFLPSDAAPHEMTEFERTAVGRVLESTSSYLRLRDDLHSSLLDYQWVRIGKETVSSALPKSEKMTWKGDSIPRDVSALSFEVTRGDALLHGLRVFNEKGTLVAEFPELAREAKQLRHSLPRRVVFHLWQPTSISRIEMSCSKLDPKSDRSPKVYAHAGRSSKPEHGKSSIYFITRAQQHLEAGRLAEAREDIGRAKQEIRLYRRNLRSE